MQRLDGGGVVAIEPLHTRTWGGREAVGDARRRLVAVLAAKAIERTGIERTGWVCTTGGG